MNASITTICFNPRTLLTTAAVVAGMIFSVAAHAGECPADKVKVGATLPSTEIGSGVTDTVIAAIDLSSKPGQAGNKLRMRRLVVAPGGVVPWHSHAERAANIYIIDGILTEYRSTCGVPIDHKAGEVVSEFGADLAHWWRNNTDKPTVLISADLSHEASKDNHPM
jgi:quercetin dioxygenase-like cupin family protein